MKTWAKSHRMFRLGLLVPEIVLIVLAFWLIKRIGRWPAVAVAQPTSQEAARPTGTVFEDGRDLALTYPAAWTLQRHDLDQPPRYLEQIQVGSSDPYPYRYVLSLETTDEPFNEIPAVQVRRGGQKEVSYQETARTVAGCAGAEFVKETGGFERTFLCLRGNRLFVAALTSPGHPPTANDTYESLLAQSILK